MLQILTMTEATLATLTSRAEVHGDDRKPAVSLGLEITTGNCILDLIDPKLRPTLFRRLDDQPDLPGVEASMPVLACNSIDRVTLPNKHEGWTLQVDDGIDETVPLTFGSCKVDKISVEPMMGGSIVLRLRVGTSDLDAARSGMLGMHVGQSIWVTLIAPKPGEEPQGEPPTGGSKGATAEDLFAAGGHDEGDESGDDADAQSAGAAAPGDAFADSDWPFPKTGPDGKPLPVVPDERTQARARTSRGREKTKAALAAGTLG